MNLKGGFKYLIIIVIAFFIGWVSFDAYSYYSNINKEQPFSITSNELKSPGDWISESDVKLMDNYVVIKAENTRWARFADTNSMDPVIDENSNSIEFKPASHDELQIGDIISFKSDMINGNVIHRIVDTGEDEEGWFAVTKGDNNRNVDPYKVRFEHIKGVVIAVLY